MSATSSTRASRPSGKLVVSSRQRFSSPNAACARAFQRTTWRCVSVAPGLMPTTRTPSSRLPVPMHSVSAISAALPAAPATFLLVGWNGDTPMMFTITPDLRAAMPAYTSRLRLM